MDSFSARLEAGKQLINQLINESINDSFEQAIVLWEKGFSMRIIQELTGVHRSKLSRYVNENDLARDDDVRSQNRKQRVHQCGRLRRMGFSEVEIAGELGVNVRTVESYCKELGLRPKTEINE